MGTPETLPRHKTTDVQRRHKHTHKCSYVFMTRRGAWARPKRSLVTKQTVERTRKGDENKTQHKLLGGGSNTHFHYRA